MSSSPPYHTSETSISSIASSPPSSFGSSTATKIRRRSSFEVLQGMAGPESLLPLPRKDALGSPTRQDDIREGVPIDSGGSASPGFNKRASSPTRTLSRIPVASVVHARALAEEGQTPIRQVPHLDLQSPDSHAAVDPGLSSSSSSNYPMSPSPSRRFSVIGTGNTTKVLADLQAGVISARTALENTKTQLRMSQRSVAQLTRQTEDLKDGRERLRLENEGLNNVVARKERLLQEVLERARAAEAEAASLKAQMKNESATSKKSLKDMETKMVESVAISQKSEREYLVLRATIKDLTEGWKADLEKVRKEVEKREEKWKDEAKEMAAKYRALLAELNTKMEVKDSINALQEENSEVRKRWEEEVFTELKELRTAVEMSQSGSDEVDRNAKNIANELARLRRLIRSTRSTEAREDGEHNASTDNQLNNIP